MSYIYFEISPVLISTQEAYIVDVKVLWIFLVGCLNDIVQKFNPTNQRPADLTELGRTPVAVVSSGCKSFLDIPRTLEYLETEGVLVGTFADGRRDNVDFPAFFTRDSGVRSPGVIQDEIEAAAIIRRFIITTTSIKFST